MGLDQYAYVGYAGQRDEYYEQDGEFSGGEWVTKGEVSRPQELAYWRKHPNLQGWMENLWIEKGKPNTGDTDADFNCIELELTWDDIDRLEKDIKSGAMAKLDTTGFFFGNRSDDYYKEHDLQFCIDAKAETFLGRKVFYNSSW